MRLVRLVRDLMGLTRFAGSRRWVSASLIDAVGSGLLMPLTVLYFTLHVGLSPASVGLGLTIGGLIALAFAPVGGILIDAVGSKPVLLSYWALAALAYAGYGVVSTWAEFLVAVTLAEIAASATSTARKSLLAEIATGQDRVRLMASQRSLRNLGFGLGGLLASVALAIGGAAYLCVVYGDAASFLLAIALVAGLPVSRRLRSAGARRPGLGGLRRVLADRRYLAVTVLDFFSSFQATGLEVALPLWIVLHTHAPRALTGILFTMNTVLVVLFQVRVSRTVRRLGDIPRAYRRAAVAMALCAGVYLAAHYVGEAAAVALLAVGIGLHTATEIFTSAGEWIASVELADDAHRGSYLSVYSLGNSLQDALGPTVVTSLLLLGGVWMWPVLAACVGVGTLATAAVVGGEGHDR